MMLFKQLSIMVQTHQLQELKEKFLESGGILLRKGSNSAGMPIILHRKNGMPAYKTRLTFTTEALRDKTFDYLITKEKFFRNGEG